MKYSRTTSISFTLLSLVGLLLLPCLVFLTPLEQQSIPWQRPIFSSLFVLVCLLGILAGLSPAKCSMVFQSTMKPREGNKDAGTMQADLRLEGHHPSCGKFSGHILRFRGNNYCAGCSGLVIGAAVSILATIVQSLLPTESIDVAKNLFWMGFTVTAVSLPKHRISNLFTPHVKSLLNFSFVTGTFLLFVSVDAITSRISVLVYFFALIVYWIAGRVYISKEEHESICSRCELSESCSLRQ
jgi:hypothetical protein